MCGLTGFWDLKASRDAAELRAISIRMSETLRLRGPDDDGVWVDSAMGIALGHRRLAIVDLSPKGHQPMVSSNGRLVLAYNGEMYNYVEIRAELETKGHSFLGDSDTEALLVACEAWGVEAAVGRFAGMFAFALWDREARNLTLVRDRLGIKPLYWGRRANVILFGSQLKSFVAHPSWTSEIDRDAMAAYLRLGYVPSPNSIYKNVHKVRPGHIIVIRPDGSVRESCYWDVRDIATRRGEVSGIRETTEAIESLDHLLRDVVRHHMVADVPLGAFLSGGTDSSTVVSLMQAQSSRPVKTFSIGFLENRFNEAVYAKAVATHLGTDHTEFYVEPQHALAEVPRLPEYYDEPFGDPSQIPTLIVSSITRRHVTVALSGDGGDEIFAGYDRYLMTEKLRAVFAVLPHRLRRLFVAAVRAISITSWDRAFAVVPRRLRPAMPGHKLNRLADILALANADAIFPQLMSFWPPEIHLLQGQQTSAPSVLEIANPPGDLDNMRLMQLVDMLTYLPDQILTKVDRASMVVSLEARVPLLDHRVVEFAWTLPNDMKIRDGCRKWLLRQVLDRYVPRALVERPKMGFGMPIDGWLRGPLRDWAESLLNAKLLREEGLFDPEPIRKRWSEHLSGRRNWQDSLWIVLMAQAWKRHWIDGHGMS